MKAIDIGVMILLIVGGLNWGLVGFFGFDVVKTVFGDMTVVSRLVYVLVGFGAVYEALQWKAIQTRWGHARA
jgi:uncharacterized membrane protein YuzA (DUF378 family)